MQALYLHEVPEWHFHTRSISPSLAMHSLRLDRVQRNRFVAETDYGPELGSRDPQSRGAFR